MSLVSRITDLATRIATEVKSKQATLVSGTNIKTINGSSILGSGNLAVAGGSATPGGSDTQVQFNNAGAFDGANVEIENGNLRLPSIATPSTPAADGINLFARKVGGRNMPAFVGPSGVDSSLQPYLARNKVSLWIASGNATTISVVGGPALTPSGTATAANVALTNLHTMMRRLEYLVTVAATNAIAGWRINAGQFARGNAAKLGGFHLVCRWGPATGVSVATTRAFVGIRASTSAPTDVNPSTLVSMIGMGWDAADTNIQLMHNDASGTATKIDTGIPRPTADRTSVYEIALFCAPNASNISYEVTDLVNDTVFSGVASTDLPANNILLTHLAYLSVGGTSSVIGMALMSLYLETDY